MDEEYPETVTLTKQELAYIIYAGMKRAMDRFFHESISDSVCQQWAEIVIKNKGKV